MQELAKGWFLMILGATVVLVTSGSAVLRPAQRARVTAILLGFGVLLAGLGAFGLDFLPKYASFMHGWKALDALWRDPQAAANGFIEKVAAGTVSPGVGAAGLARLVSDPVEGLEEKVRAAAAKAPAGSEQKRVLEVALQDLEERRKEAEQLVLKGVDAGQAAGFSPGTVDRMRAMMERLPASEKARLGITDREVLAFRKLAVGRRKPGPG